MENAGETSHRGEQHLDSDACHNTVDWPTVSEVKTEITRLVFWKSLLLSLLWSAGGALFVFIAGHVWRWKGGPHELISFIILPIPVTLIVAWFAGWWHRSRRVLWMVRVIGGLICLVWLPIALLGLILAIGFSGVR